MAVWMSWRNFSAENGRKRREPFARSSRISGTWTAAVPSESIHDRVGGGSPCAWQSILPPATFENSAFSGGSCRNTGPCRSNWTPFTETQIRARNQYRKLFRNITSTGEKENDLQSFISTKRFHILVREPFISPQTVRPWIRSTWIWGLFSYSKWTGHKYLRPFSPSTNEWGYGRSSQPREWTEVNMKFMGSSETCITWRETSLMHLTFIQQHLAILSLSPRPSVLSILRAHPVRAFREDCEDWVISL